MYSSCTPHFLRLFPLEKIIHGHYFDGFSFNKKKAATVFVAMLFINEAFSCDQLSRDFRTSMGTPH
jgi:hypothetical protein